MQIAYLSLCPTLLIQIGWPIIVGAIFAFLLLVWTAYIAFKYFKRKVLLQRLTLHLSPYYTPEQIRDALAFYIPTRYRYAQDGEEIRDNLIPYFTQEVFINNHREFKYYFIMGMPGIGKSCFLINLFWNYRYRLIRKDFKIKLIALNHPHAIKDILSTPQQDQTVLMIDAFDEDIYASQNYSQRLKELIQLTHDFAKVLISCRSYFFPFELEKPFESKAISFQEEDCYQLISKIYIDPFDEKDAYAYLQKKLPFYHLNLRVKAQALHKQNPYLLSRPLLLNYINYLLDGGQTFYEYTYQVYTDIIHQWIREEAGNNKEDVQGKYYSFLADVAWNMYDSYEDRDGLLIPKEEMQEICHHHNIEITLLKRKLIQQHPLGYYFFTHQSFISYFVAWQAFFEESYTVDTSFKGLMVASILYQELCWERYATQFQYVQGQFRTVNNNTLRPLSNLKAWELRFIRRLYLVDYLKKDLRFIRGLSYLNGLYLYNGEEQDLTPELLQALPNPDVNIYLYNDGEDMVVLKTATVPMPLLEVDGEAELAYQWDAPKKINLFSVVDRSRIYQAQINGTPPSEEILSLFNMNLKHLPDATCQQIESKTNHNGVHYKVFEQRAGFGELEVFNELQVILFPDGSKNIHFRNSYTPTLFHKCIAKIVENMVRIYGIDDRELGEYTEDDAAQVEDGFWFGRKWAWQQTHGYAYPIHFFMPKSGELHLMVYGLHDN